MLTDLQRIQNTATKDISIGTYKRISAVALDVEVVRRRQRKCKC